MIPNKQNWYFVQTSVDSCGHFLPLLTFSTLDMCGVFFMRACVHAFKREQEIYQGKKR